MSGHALVTGASSGIGAAIARRLLDEGWSVTGVARRETAFPSPAYRGLSCDLSDRAACAAMIREVGETTAFVHAAGFMTTDNIGSLDPEKLAAMWRVHVEAAEIIANALVPVMDGNGRIVLIGSRTANGAPGRSQYAATKAALVAMARSWAMELAARGITVNVVAPAATETPMLSAPGRSSAAPRLPPIGRMIRPEEVAAAVSYLLSREAAPVTGQVLTICGGASL